MTRGTSPNAANGSTTRGRSPAGSAAIVVVVTNVVAAAGVVVADGTGGVVVVVSTGEVVLVVSSLEEVQAPVPSIRTKNRARGRLIRHLIVVT
jgi:hypothetical protein